MDIKRIFPFLSWFPLTSDKLKADILAGITVALLLIPQSMAYADLAGLPYIYGLNAAFIPTIIGALFGWSFHLSTGPVAMTSILTASVLVSFAPPGSPEYVQLAILFCFMIGIIRLIIGLLKLSRISNLISYPVILGFTNGAAILIGFSQLPKLLHIKMETNPGYFGTIREAFYLLTHLSESHFPTLLMGLFALGLMMLLERFKKIPSVLITVVITTVLSLLCGYETRWNGTVIGFIPKGLNLGVSMSWVEIQNLLPLLWKMIPSAFFIVLIGFLEVLGVSKSISTKSGQRMNYDQEMIGQGMAAIAAGFSSAYPVSGSFSRSALGYSSGGRTGLTQVITSVIVLVVLLFLTPLLYHLPTPVLAISIMMAVKRLIDFKRMREFWRQSKREFFLSWITFAVTLISAPNITLGITLGVIFSLIISFIMDRPGGFTEPEIRDELLIVRIRRTILFTRINQLEEAILDKMLVTDGIKYLKIKARSIKKIDISGMEGLDRLAEKFRKKGGALVFIGLSPSLEQFISAIKHSPMKFFRNEEEFHNYLICLQMK